MAEQPNRLIALVRQQEIAEAKQQADDEAFRAYCDRRLERLKSWAMKQDQEELAESFALAALLAIERKKTQNTMRRGLDLHAGNKQELEAALRAQRAVALEYAREVLDNRQARRLGAKRRLENDPKQMAKAGALQLWLERHEGRHPRLRTVEQYAIEVMRRWPVLTSSKVITGWSAQWSKDVRAGRTPAS